MNRAEVQGSGRLAFVRRAKIAWALFDCLGDSSPVQGEVKLDFESNGGSLSTSDDPTDLESCVAKESAPIDDLPDGTLMIAATVSMRCLGGALCR